MRDNPATSKQAGRIIDLLNERLESNVEVQELLSTGVIPLIFEAVPTNMDLGILARMVWRSKFRIVREPEQLYATLPKEHLTAMVSTRRSGQFTFDANWPESIRFTPRTLNIHRDYAVVESVRPMTHDDMHKAVIGACWENADLTMLLTYQACGAGPYMDDPLELPIHGVAALDAFGDGRGGAWYPVFRKDERGRLFLAAEATSMSRVNARALVVMPKEG